MSYYLVDLHKAKRHLYQEGRSDNDQSIEDKILEASAILLNYIEYDELPDEWYDDNSPATVTAPRDIQAATVLIVSELYENREASNSDPLSPSVKSLLRRYRLPAMG